MPMQSDHYFKPLPVSGTDLAQTIGDMRDYGVITSSMSSVKPYTYHVQVSHLTWYSVAICNGGYRVTSPDGSKVYLPHPGAVYNYFADMGV